MNNIMEAIRCAIEDITGRKCRVTATGELECVCPKCGGSKTRRNKKQFYISLTEPGNPFICFRCGFKGTLKTLVKFLNEELKMPIILRSSLPRLEAAEEKKENNSMELFYNINSIRRRQYEVFKRTKKLENVYCPNCRHYIMSRIFGNSFFNSNNFEENFLSNIAANILCCNNIKTATKQKYKDFIGISSFSGSVIQLRKIKEDYNIRYLSLKTTQVLPENYFVVNLENKIGNRTLILAEGVFTLLRGYLYLKNIGYIDNINTTLVATFGKNNFIKEVCNPQILKYYNQVVALLDSDVTLYKSLPSKVKLLKPISKKDFGEIEINSNKKEFKEEKNEYEKLHYRAYGGKL